MLVDKKGVGGYIDLVLLTDIGKACLHRMPKDELYALMAGGAA